MASSGRRLISSEDRRLLERVTPQLMASVNIEGSTLLAELRMRGAITETQQQDIECERGNNKMVERLIHYLRRGDENTVDKVVYSMRHSGQSHTAETFLPQPREPDHWTHGLHNRESLAVSDRETETSTDANMEELKEELRRNMKQKLEDWQSSLQKLILEHSDDEVNMYIHQKITATTGRKEEKLEASNLHQLLEQHCDEHKRVAVYGDAGSGKSTTLRYIAHSWLNESTFLAQNYDLVFLMPLRLVRSHRITDMICQDLELISEQRKDRLSKMLDMRSRRTLFLLDSFEELSFDTKELDKLLACEIHPNSTVLVTSRPGSRLTMPMPRITVQLQDLSEGDVKEYITQYCSKEDQLMFSQIQKKFGMPFLKRPINLALVCFMYVFTDFGRKGLDKVSQTMLFEQIFLHILPIYLEKRYRVTNLDLQNVLSIFSNVRLVEAKLVFLELCKMCYEGVRAKRQWVNTNTLFTDQDLMDFGLFIHGSGSSVAVLPHMLFQEFLAAIYLVREHAARRALFAEIHECQRESPQPYLENVLRQLGLENVIRFIFGLSPSDGRELCSLFVIRQHKIENIDFYQSVYLYELELLHECTDDSVKSDMALKLFNAPVVTLSGEYDIVEHNRTEQICLLGIFTDEQCRLFLRKTYECELNVKTDGSLAMSRINSDDEIPTRTSELDSDNYDTDNITAVSTGAKGSPAASSRSQTGNVARRALNKVISVFRGKSHGTDKNKSKSSDTDSTSSTSHTGPKSFIIDSYVVGCLQKYRCTSVEIGSVMRVRDSDLPLNVLSLLITAVGMKKLSIHDCTTLCGESADHLHRLMQSMSPPTLPRIEIESSQLSVDVVAVMAAGVREDVTINLCTLLCGGGDVVHSSQQPLTPPTVVMRLEYVRGLEQLRHITLPHVLSLRLWYCGHVDTCCLPPTFPQLAELELDDNSLLYSDHDDITPINSMRKLVLHGCDVKLDVFRKMCPGLQTLLIGGCPVSVDGAVDSWQSLQRLELDHSHIILRDKWLSVEKAERTLRKICPQPAIVDIECYQCPRCEKYVGHSWQQRCRCNK